VYDLNRGQIQICDYLVSKLADIQASELNKHPEYLSSVYSAPELYTTSYTNKVDVYSFGMM
jgi:hypothetical protein